MYSHLFVQSYEILIFETDVESTTVSTCSCAEKQNFKKFIVINIYHSNIFTNFIGEHSLFIDCHDRCPSKPVHRSFHKCAGQLNAWKRQKKQEAMFYFDKVNTIFCNGSIHIAIHITYSSILSATSCVALNTREQSCWNEFLIPRFLQ